MGPMREKGDDLVIFKRIEDLIWDKQAASYMIVEQSEYAQKTYGIRNRDEGTDLTPSKLLNALLVLLIVGGPEIMSIWCLSKGNGG